MIDVEFRMGGRKVSFDKGWDEMEAQMLTEARKNIQRKLAHIRCPAHGGAPCVVAEGPSVERLEFLVYGCCDRLVDEATKVLEQPTPDP